MTDEGPAASAENKGATDAPVVEPKPAAARGANVESLAARLRQQEILAELGVFALQGPSFSDLLNETARLTAEGLEAEFSKVMEYLPLENRLLVRAGVGWSEGVVGSASVGADLESPAGFALHSGRPVISNHLKDERRFRTPELLLQHGIRRAMNVILQGEGKPFGVLEVDSRSPGEFGERDIAFLQGAANILGMAIERQRTERQLTAALAHQKVLVEEINHRTKNSLQLVSSMLQLQARSVGDAQVGEHLAVAAGRVSAVGRLYARLTYRADFDKIDLGAYLREVCADMAAAQSDCGVHVEVEGVVMLAPEQAIHLGLIVNELVTNACKYAYPGRTDGQIWVRVERDGTSLRLSVRDEGVGLPPLFNVDETKGLGMRIVRSLTSPLGATLTTKRRTPGVEFIVVVPQDAGGSLDGPPV
jgi:two-component sensor histidine kinase